MPRSLRAPRDACSAFQIAEIHFPSREALEACLASPGGQETAAHAFAISSGGSPILLIGEEETFTF
jgi:hypothetical protein